jgi:PleD family two-component response regulator
MKAKVMVVDDTEGVRELIGTILQRNGYEPVPKANAAQLLASFTEPSPTSSCWTWCCPTATAWNCCRKSRSNGRTPKS